MRVAIHIIYHPADQAESSNASMLFYQILIRENSCSSKFNRIILILASKQNKISYHQLNYN
jgi:hypothetical protein